MFVIDGVVLQALEEPGEVRELERGRAVRGKQDRDAVDEIIEIRHLGEHVVPDHQVGDVPLRAQPLGKLDAEELDERRDASLLRCLRDVCRRVDAEYGNAPGQEVL
jgi:hypothetical protein